MKNLTITPYIKDKNRLKNGKAEVYLRIRTTASPVNFPSNCYVDVKRFEATNKFSKGKLDSNETEAKDYLNGLVKKLNQIEQSFIEAGTSYTVEMIKNRILERDVQSVAKGKTLADAFVYFKEWFMISVKKDEVKEESFDRYEVLERHLNKFIKKEYKQTSFLLSAINDDFQNAFHLYLVADEKITKKNTTIKYIVYFRKVIKIAVQKKYLNSYPLTDYKMVKEVENPLMALQW